jgi:REP element-mobilizing transposase RayT
VASATANREPVFADAALAELLLAAIQYVRDDRAYILAYAITPDHFHVLLVPKAPYSISQVMQTIKGFSSRVSLGPWAIMAG